MEAREELQGDRFPAHRSRPRETPLEPLAVVASGAVARALVRHLLAWPEQDQRGERCLADLRAACVGDSLFLLGETRSLPWVDGVQYLGRDPEAPELLMPTHVSPALPISWLRGALERAAKERSVSPTPPLAVCLEPPRLVNLASARALCRADLEHWQAELERLGGVP